MLNILYFLIALGVMVTVHEGGHFLAARLFGVGIEKFSIGFGKPIAEFERKGIKYCISWIPLGGYLKMMGENPDEADEAVNEQSFMQKAWWKRALIAFSGPFANLILGLLLYILAFTLPQKQEDLRPIIHKAEGIWEQQFLPGDSLMAVNGKPVKGFNEFLIALDATKPNSILLSRSGENKLLSIAPSQVDSLIRSLQPKVDTVIGEVYSGMPAWRAGLYSGDKVLAVDSVQVSDWYSMRELIVGSRNKSVQLTIRRGKEILTRDIVLEQSLAMGNQRLIGIAQHMPIKSVEHYSLPQAFSYGWQSSVGFIVMNYVGFYQLIKQPEQLKSSLGGPVMMATMTNEAGKRGFSYLLIFFASISLILAIMNLLPIPILDGGLIFFAIWEGIIGRPIPIRIQGILQRIGLALLLMLMFFAFYADISKLVLRLFAING